MHEIGHLLGLPDIDGQGVMNGRINLAADHLTAEDRRELRRVFSPL